MMGWFLVLAVAPLLVFHAIVAAHLIITERWAKEVARARGLADWMVGSATRNKTRASRFILGGVATVAAAAWLGATADDQAGAWRLGAAGFAVGFNLVAIVVECAGVVAQRRLVAEIKARVGRTPTERQGFEPVSV